jgi:anti-sigma factor RsiW
MVEYPAGYTCEVFAFRLDSYLLETLARAEALALAEHLEACAPCAERVELRRESDDIHRSRTSD